MTELKNIRIPLIISLALRKGEIREGLRKLLNPEPIPTLPLESEGLIVIINLGITILSFIVIQENILK